MRGEAKNGKLMAITWLARTAERASAGMALSRTYSPLRRPPARSFARCSMPDENGRRSMKEARLLSERASERASIALPERGKDLFVAGSSNYGAAKAKLGRRRRERG